MGEKRAVDEMLEGDEPKRAKKPCKCGSTEHSRSSAKTCPKYNARKSRKAKVEGTKERTSTTKIGFNRFLAEPELAPIVDNAVKTMAYISFEACRLANAYILHLLGEGLPIPPLDYNRFMRLPFQAVIRTSNPLVPKQTSNALLNQVRDQIYAPCRPQGMEWMDGAGLGQVISNTAREYATNAQNHVVTNLPKRLWRWVSWKLEKRLQFLEHQTIRSLASFIVDALKANKIPSIPDTIRDIQDPEHRIDAEIWFCNVFQKAKTIILEDRSLAEDNVKGSWWSYLRPLWRILRTFEKNNRDDAEARRTTRRQGRGLRLFSLLPLTAFHRRFILIDTDTLYTFFGRINWMGIGRPTLADFGKCAEDWWRMGFRLERVVTQTRRFGFSIATDGTNVSVYLKKEVAEWDGVNRIFFAQYTATREDKPFHALRRNGTRRPALRGREKNEKHGSRAETCRICFEAFRPLAVPTSPASKTTSCIS